MADIRTRASRYSNPRLGAAFENLADVFAPPTGSDLYGYTRAAGEKQKQMTLADIVARSRDPNTDRRVLDQLNAAAGNHSPTQGWVALETKDATDRRGQDITSGDNRYNVNSRDSTARRGQDISADVDLRRAIMAPTPKDAVVTVDPGTAKQYGIPETRRGIVAAQPGERNVLPDGTEINGVPKPKTTQ